TPDQIAGAVGRFHPQITIRLRSARVSVVAFEPDSRPRVAVVGAGIAGLAAAHELARDGRVDVVVLEGSPRTGGKLLRGEVAGVATDLGAESVLARRPEGL